MQTPAVEVQAQFQPLQRKRLARYEEGSYGQRQHHYVVARVRSGTNVP
ncbi:hypothetical protein DWUX_26 [Desulfovibrio diazotrophicus]|nr:hypothetical protein DWUX_26 [Desulfovibrio diazotrophicus]